MNNPRLRPRVPIMLGGSGERKAFRLAALHADHLNIICDVADLPRKVAALRERCAEAGRDPATLATSYLAAVMMTESEDQAKRMLDSIPPERQSRVFVGTPEQVAERLQRDVLDQGIDGIVINMIRNGHEPGMVSTAAETLKPLVG